MDTWKRPQAVKSREKGRKPQRADFSFIPDKNGGASMGNVRRIYVEKKAPFAVKAKELKGDLKN